MQPNYTVTWITLIWKIAIFPYCLSFLGINDVHEQLLYKLTAQKEKIWRKNGKITVIKDSQPRRQEKNHDEKKLRNTSFLSPNSNISFSFQLHLFNKAVFLKECRFIVENSSFVVSGNIWISTRTTVILLMLAFYVKKIIGFLTKTAPVYQPIAWAVY